MIFFDPSFKRPLEKGSQGHKNCKSEIWPYLLFEQLEQSKEVTEQLLISDIKSCMKNLCAVTYQISFFLFQFNIEIVYLDKLIANLSFVGHKL